MNRFQLLSQLQNESAQFPFMSVVAVSRFNGRRGSEQTDSERIVAFVPHGGGYDAGTQDWDTVH